MELEVSFGWFLVFLVVLMDGRHENMKELTSMSFANRGTTEMLVGGLQDSILRVNLDRGQVTNEVQLIPRRNCKVIDIHSTPPSLEYA